MGKVAIVTDSTATIPADVISDLGIHVVPLTLVWGEETYLDGVEVTAEQFYERLQSDTNFPSTTQPSALEFENVYKTIANNYDSILVITISSELSGTYNSAVQAKDMMNDINIEIIDTKTMSMAAGFIVLAAAKAAKEGKGLSECTSIAKEANQNVGVLVALDTLEYLHRGGRIGGARKLLGGALNIKPILTVQDGIVSESGKVRTKKKALRYLIDTVSVELEGKTNVRLSGLHASQYADCEKILGELVDIVNPTQSLITELSPVVGAHAGPGAIGIAWMHD
ncbi:MAG: EDD domain protein [Gammaproteobacteria bacterium]|nr:EDD domain protein [Gammaproteobacteria bacterium]